MQGLARFTWQAEQGHTGECSAVPWLASESTSAPGHALPQEPALSRKPKARRAAPVTLPAPPPKDLLEGFCPEPGQEEIIAVNSKGLMISLRLAEVEWMEGADKCVKLHVGRHIHRLRDPLAVVAAKLPPGRFLRISRSVLVNVEQIKGLQRMLFDEYEVVLRNGKRLALTRAYCANLQQVGLSLPASTVPIINPRFTLGRPASN
jgi:hypothetical protein